MFFVSGCSVGRRRRHANKLLNLFIVRSELPEVICIMSIIFIVPYNLFIIVVFEIEPSPMSSPRKFGVHITAPSKPDNLCTTDTCNNLDDEFGEFLSCEG